MKLTTQLTVVICVGIAGMVAMVAFLSAAGWSEGGIAGMVTGIGSVVTGLVVAIRNQNKTQETLQDQNEVLDRVVEQTNGKSEAEVQRIALLAVAEAKRQGLL
jgi:hypothetical protein